MSPTRRQVLTGGALGALGWIGAFAIGHRPLASIDSPFLGSGRHTLVAALEVLLPSLDDARAVADGVDAFLATGDPIPAEQLRMALLVLEHAGGASPWQPQRFSRLSLDERRAVLAGFERSRFGLFRQIFQALRKTAAFAHYARPETWADIGYDGPWVRR